ncbi:MAG TPA: glycosyl hydrolase family 8, partial [Burkholderiaceae bacterium]
DYNAIRVYLWAGMLADDEPLKSVLLKTYAPMREHIARHGTPPIEIDTRTGVAKGVAPVGFSAALLPFLAASKQDDLVRQQKLRVDAKPPSDGTENYYEQALSVFGLGWMEGRYKFNRDGALSAQWTCAAK